MTPLQDENLKAFTKLLEAKEHEDKIDQSRYRYYEDLYNNQYRWTTHPQADGKYKATILKAKTSGNWLRFDTKKTRYFKQRKSAKAYCLKAYLKAQEHQKEVIARREIRKEEYKASKPKLTKSDKIQTKINHLNHLVKKTETKVKAHTTRLRKYQKKIKYYQKELIKSKA